MSKSVYAGKTSREPGRNPSVRPSALLSLFSCLAHSSLAYLAPISFPLQISRPLRRGTNAHYQYAEQSQAVHSLSRQRENVEQAREACLFLGCCLNRLRGTHATLWGIYVLMSEHPSSLSCSSRVWGSKTCTKRDRQHLNVTMKSIRCRVTFCLGFFSAPLPLTGIFRRLETDHNTSSSDLACKAN